MAPGVSLLVKGGLLVTQDDGRRVVEGNLYVEGGRVAEVAGPERGADQGADHVLDAAGCLVLPGLVNAYTRAVDLLLGPPRDLPPEDLRERRRLLRENLTRRDVELAAAAAAAEMLLGGTTSFLDLFPGAEELARAVTQVGSRGFPCWEVASPEELEGCAKGLARVQAWDRVEPSVGVANPEDPALLEEVAAFAEDRGLRWCLPLARTRREVYRFQRATGDRPGAWLEARGLLSPRLLALHAVWLTLNEIRALGRSGAQVVHCPLADAMGGTGGSLALPEVRAEGVSVALGTASPAQVGTLDLFQHMRGCAGQHKAARWDPGAATASLVLDLCTRGGAKVLGLEGGSLQAGTVADVVVLDLRGRRPPRDPSEVLSYLVYLAEGGQVRDVVVEGRIVVENGALTGVDVAALREDVEGLRREVAP